MQTPIASLRRPPTLAWSIPAASGRPWNTTQELPTSSTRSVWPVQSITTALAATSSADPETTSSHTTPVTRTATRPAWKAGWDQSATKVCDKCSACRAAGLGGIWGHRAQVAFSGQVVQPRGLGLMGQWPALSTENWGQEKRSLCLVIKSWRGLPSTGHLADVFFLWLSASLPLGRKPSPLTSMGVLLLTSKRISPLVQNFKTSRKERLVLKLT